MWRVLVMVAIGACSGKAGSPPPPASGSATDASALPSSGSNRGSSAGSNGPDAGSGGAGSAALDPRIAAARCDEPCLFLVDTPLDAMLDAYKTACGKATPDLGYGDCAALDYARNCIYAAHGLVSKRKKLKVFATKPWYQSHPEFKANQISALERANVHELNTRGKACKRGTRVSPADLARAKVWFSTLAKRRPPLPPLVFREKTPITAKELEETMVSDLGGPDVRSEIGLSDRYSADYEDPSPELVALLGVPTGTKLRVMVIEVDTYASEETTEGIDVRFVYDDHDRWLALDVTHFLLD